MADTNLKKNKQGYGYKYTDLAQIHQYLEENNLSYYQYVETDVNGADYIMTVVIKDGKELPPRKGCRVIQATLSGKSNPAQEQGSALTYARRYSLLMAFGLATEDDDAESLTRKPQGKAPAKTEEKPNINALKEVVKNNGIDDAFLFGLYGIKSYDEITAAKYKNIIENIDKIKAKQDEKGDK